MTETDILIIGAGPVGIFAAFQAGMLGMKSIIVDACDAIGGQCNALYPEKPIYDIPGFDEISAAHLVDRLVKQASYFNPEYLLNEVASSLIEKQDGSIVTSMISGKIVKSKAVIIAIGSGRIKHKSLPIENASDYEGKTLFYAVKEKNLFKDKIVTIAGGGDSAVDWVNELAKICRKVHIIHRREKFACMEQSYKIMLENIAKGLVEVQVPYQLRNIHGRDGYINMVEIIDFDNNIKNIETDFLLAFFGLDSNLGEIENWDLEMQKKHLLVDHATMQTSRKAIFAIGDICAYPGKLKLILTGFAEASLACHSAYNYVFVGKKLHFEYSTTKGLSKI